MIKRIDTMEAVELIWTKFFVIGSVYELFCFFSFVVDKSFASPIKFATSSITE